MNYWDMVITVIVLQHQYMVVQIQMLLTITRKLTQKMVLVLMTVVLVLLRQLLICMTLGEMDGTEVLLVLQ